MRGALCDTVQASSLMLNLLPIAGGFFWLSDSQKGGTPRIFEVLILHLPGMICQTIQVTLYSSRCLPLDSVRVEMFVVALMERRHVVVPAP